MANIGNILLEKEILLESGTNEVEVLVFRVGDYSLGVNVAKVREVLPSQKITHLPKAHDSVVGCFTLREQVVPCVSLHRHLGEGAANEGEEATIILTEFNQCQNAFVVDSVERIHRVSWKNVLAAPSIVNNTDTPVTAVTSIDGRLILMLDFEMIADQVSEKAHRIGPVDNPQGLPRESLRILLADDSATVREAVSETLRSSGYTNLTTFENGEQVWNWLHERVLESGDVGQIADLLISDVEMPRIDGLHLTKKIKEHPELRKMCVLLYSSILTTDNRNKGLAVKADGMITKPELSKIVDLADELIVKTLHCKEDTAVAESSPEAISEIPTSVAKPVAKPDTETQHNSNTKQDPTDVLSPSIVTTENETKNSEPVVGSHPNSSLWITFRNELGERVEQLSTLCRAAVENVPSDEVLNDTLRVLHSVKSASMVIPIDEIAHITHLVEDVMDIVRQEKNRWPHAEMSKYVDWLNELANPANDAIEVQAVLTEANRLEKEITVGASG